MSDAMVKLRKARDILEGVMGDLRHETLPPWYHTARGEIGVREIPGDEHEARVLEYLMTCSRDRGGTLGAWGAGRDETPWCSAFVSWCLERAGVSSTRSAWARSYEGWGLETEPRQGCVVVLTRGEGGHVAFLERVDGDQVSLLGGNQGNAVSVRPYPVSRVLAYRWPVEG